MLGNLVAVIADRITLTPAEVAWRIAEEYGDGDYGIAEDRLWDRFGPLIDQVQTELGLEE